MKSTRTHPASPLPEGMYALTPIISTDRTEHHQDQPYSPSAGPSVVPLNECRIGNFVQSLAWVPPFSSNPRKRGSSRVNRYISIEFENSFQAWPRHELPFGVPLRHSRFETWRVQLPVAHFRHWVVPHCNDATVRRRPSTGRFASLASGPRRGPIGCADASS